MTYKMLVGAILLLPLHMPHAAEAEATAEVEPLAQQTVEPAAPTSTDSTQGAAQTDNDAAAEAAEPDCE